MALLIIGMECLDCVRSRRTRHARVLWSHRSLDRKFLRRQEKWKWVMNPQPPYNVNQTPIQCVGIHCSVISDLRLSAPLSPLASSLLVLLLWFQINFLQCRYKSLIAGLLRCFLIWIASWCLDLSWKAFSARNPRLPGPLEWKELAWVPNDLAHLSAPRVCVRIFTPRK